MCPDPNHPRQCSRAVGHSGECRYPPKFKVSTNGREALRKHIQDQLKSDAASGVPFEGSVSMLAHWVVGLLENRDDERLFAELTGQDQVAGSRESTLNRWRKKRQEALDALELDAKEISGLSEDGKKWVNAEVRRQTPVQQIAEGAFDAEAPEDERIWLPK